MKGPEQVQDAFGAWSAAVALLWIERQGADVGFGHGVAHFALEERMHEESDEIQE